MLDPASLAQPPIRGADLDKAQRLVQALGALSDLVDAAGDLHGVRADRLSCLLAAIVEPLEAELEGLATRAEAGEKPA